MRQPAVNHTATYPRRTLRPYGTRNRRRPGRRPQYGASGDIKEDDVDVEAISVRKTIYLPAPYMGISLECDLKPDEVWSCL